VQVNVGMLFYDRSPTWGDILFPVSWLVLWGIFFIFDISSGSGIYWPVVPAGFLLPVCAAIVESAWPRMRLGQWYKNRNVDSRILFVITFLLIIVSTALLGARVGHDAFEAFVKGSMIGYFLYCVVWAVWAGEVSGLRSGQNTTD
jgi:hypothetical protein